MTDWKDLCETVLTQFQAATGITYDFERFETNDENPQLPDTFIVYFMVDDPPGSHFDNAEVTHTPRIQISLYYRQKPIALTVPDQIESAFMDAGFMRVGPGRIPYQENTAHYGWRCDFRLYETR